jgi:hypothetical protein
MVYFSHVNINGFYDLRGVFPPRVIAVSVAWQFPDSKAVR